MKFLSIILSVYLLVLTAIPCIDEPRDNVLQKIELSQNPTDNHQSDASHCSPFCTCSCCASPIIYQVHTILFNCYSFALEQHPGNMAAYVSSICSAIWQPPKIS